jgi:hypothetical protein
MNINHPLLDRSYMEAIEKMRKKPNYNDLARKWPLPFRNGIKFYSASLGLLIITIEGGSERTSEMLKQMEKCGLLFNSVSSSIDVDIQGEDALSSFAMTTITFREYQAPPLENGGKSDRQILKKIKPQQTETGLDPQESVRSGCSISPDHHQGGDMSR